MAPARFEALGEEYILRIVGDFGSDTVFLAEKRTEDSVGELAFDGTAASVLDRKDGLTLSLGVEGTVRVGNIPRL